VRRRYHSYHRGDSDQYGLLYLSSWSQIGKRLEGYIERLREIERSKSEKKESSKRLAAIKSELDKGDKMYKQLVEEINTLSESYEEISKELNDAQQKVIRPTNCNL